MLMHPTGDGLDAEALAARLERLHRSLCSDMPAEGLELYHRAALTLRVGDDGDGRVVTTRRGRDEGLALRTANRFAAGSGSSAAGLLQAIERTPDGPSTAGREPWDRGGVRRADHDGVPELPPVAELTGWLDRAREALAQATPGRWRPLEMWVETAATVESWVADGGLRASRTRLRGWALLRMREPWAGDRGSKPVLVARRRWDELPPEALRSVLEDRRLPGGPEQVPPTASTNVLFSPECSAKLAQALVKTLHGADVEPALAVGPAWRVEDDPLSPQALFGGSFDDAGFATRRTRLAGAGRRTAGIGGRGHYRRPSFRDRPVPMPAHLVLTGAGSAAPERGVVATALGLHALEPTRWLLRIAGAHLERRPADRGRPAAPPSSRSRPSGPGPALHGRRRPASPLPPGRRDPRPPLRPPPHRVKGTFRF